VGGRKEFVVGDNDVYVVLHSSFCSNYFNVSLVFNSCTLSVTSEFLRRCYEIASGSAAPSSLMEQVIRGLSLDLGVACFCFPLSSKNVKDAYCALPDAQRVCHYTVDALHSFVEALRAFSWEVVELFHDPVAVGLNIALFRLREQGGETWTRGGR